MAQGTPDSMPVRSIARNSSASPGVMTVMPGMQRMNDKSRLPLCVAPSGPTSPARSTAKVTGKFCRQTSWTI
jgi:hypothetical protein